MYSDTISVLRMSLSSTVTTGWHLTLSARSRGTLRMATFISSCHHRGFILTEKVLSEGKFLRPIYDESAKCYRMSWPDFVRMLEGIVPGKEYYRPARCSEQGTESDLGENAKS